MIDIIKPLLSRLIGSSIGALAGALAVKLGIVVDPATQASITTALVLGVYGIAHKLVDRCLYPTPPEPAAVP